MDRPESDLPDFIALQPRPNADAGKTARMTPAPVAPQDVLDFGALA